MYIPLAYLYGTDLMCRCHDYTFCTICPPHSPECIKVQHFEGKNRFFFWGPGPTATGEGFPVSRLHSRRRIDRPPTIIIFNKFTHMNSCGCDVFLYCVTRPCSFWHTPIFFVSVGGPPMKACTRAPKTCLRFC